MRRSFFILALIIPSLTFGSAGGQGNKNNNGNKRGWEQDQNPHSSGGNVGGEPKTAASTQQPAPLTSNSQDAVENSCPFCDSIGFSLLPTATIDGDRNRFILYLGTNDVVKNSKDAIQQEGPFNVLDFGTFSAGIGVSAVASVATAGSGLLVGLSVSAGTSYESSRVVNTYKEAKELPRISKFPKEYKEFEELPPGTVIITKMTGTITFTGGAALGYVASVTGEASVSGQWVVKIVKPNNYEVKVTLQDLYSTSKALSGRLALGSVRESRTKQKAIAFTFELNLRDKRGRKAYEELLDGKVSAVQALFKDMPKIVKQIKEDSNIEGLFTPLEESKSKTKSKDRTYSIGIPFLLRAERTAKHYDLIDEEVRYLKDQDNTILGSVVDGTILYSIRGAHYTSKKTGGLISDHKSRIKKFNVKMEEISIPYIDQKGNFERSVSRRTLFDFSYSFQQNNWDTKDWVDEIKFMSRRIGAKELLLNSMKNIAAGKKIESATIESHIKISDEAMRRLVEEAGRNILGLTRELSNNAKKNVSDWFAQEENSRWEMCDILINCKNRAESNAVSGVEKGLKILNDIYKLYQEEARGDKKSKELVQAWSEFGKHFTRNQFSVHAYLDKIKMYKKQNPKYDFAFCVSWAGSSFRRGVLEIEKSSLRKDKKKCNLQEETQVDQVAIRKDIDFFGDDFILD